MVSRDRAQIDQPRAVVVKQAELRQRFVAIDLVLTDPSRPEEGDSFAKFFGS